MVRREMTAAKAVAEGDANDPVLRSKALRPGDRSAERANVRGDLPGLLAHDLKTPLAAISMNLDFALAELRLGATDGLCSALEDCREANLRAIRIVSDMGDAARLLSGEFQATPTYVSVTSVVQEVVQQVRPQAAERRVHILWATDDTAVVGDGELLAKAIERLLERALRHARSGSEVEIDQRGCLVTIRVETMAEASVEASTKSLAMHYAEAALSAQGGRVWTEANGDALLYRISLPE
jgi:signal transduction histidine kinase